MSSLPAHLQSMVIANNAVYDDLRTAWSIRVLGLNPGRGDEEISCSLFVVDLQLVHPFHALSYCWGTESAVRHVNCNGRALRVTQNLYLALQQLRMQSDVRYMWIDAVCINQNSITERNHQVPLMRQIYQKAATVIVWLGEEDDTTILALQTMQGIFKTCCLKMFGDRSFEQWLVKLQEEEPWRMLRTNIAKTVSPEWPGDPKTCARALRSFFGRPWFYRVWVIQEVQGCPDIMLQVGAKTLPWDVAALSATWVVYAPSEVTRIWEPQKFGGFLHADFMHQKNFSTKDHAPFLEVLDRCRAFQCTIDKDRIFALLQHPVTRQLGDRDNVESHITESHPLRMDVEPYASHFGLKPDYNMTLFEVYRQIVLGSIAESRSLQVLSHVPENSTNHRIYPTWMPLWHVGGSRFTGPNRYFLYDASKGFEPRVLEQTNPTLLGLRGILVGTVVKTSTNIRVLSCETEVTEVIQFGTTLEELWKVSELIVRGCWQPQDNWLQNAIRRTTVQSSAHFRDFCAFIFERLQKASGLTVVSLHGKWCNICKTRHTASPSIIP